MLAIPGANVVGVQFTPTGIVLDLLPRPGCTHRPRPGPARIVTGRDGAGKLSVCDWFGSLARSSPCRRR
jgi:hypothetical protein